MFTPYYRPRRLRKNEDIRRMVRETILTVNDLIYPMFVVEGKGVKNEISSMPGNYQLSIDLLVKEVKEVHNLGVPAIILFGIPSKKDALGSDATSDDGIVQRAVKAIKDEVPNIYVITDVCFCEYTDHGHCGAIKNGTVDNDATLDMLGQQVVTHGKAG
ncbi:MAG: porphobilinogen synthase, partial [Calditrichaceae bacterium]